MSLYFCILIKQCWQTLGKINYFILKMTYELEDNYGYQDKIFSGVLK